MVCDVLPSPFLHPSEIYQVVETLFRFESPTSGYQQAAPVLYSPLDGSVNFPNQFVCFHINVD
jgi:hypothetical protein